MSDSEVPDAKKLSLVLAAIDAGLIQPDPLELVWAAGVLRDQREWKLAREFERRARRLLPNLARDLS